jgi:hypothetical protein
MSLAEETGWPPTEETAGDQAMAALVGVQPVQYRRFVGGGVPGRVQVHRPVPPRHLAHPPGQRVGQAEHLPWLGSRMVSTWAPASCRAATARADAQHRCLR